MVRAGDRILGSQLEAVAWSPWRGLRGPGQAGFSWGKLPPGSLQQQPPAGLVSVSCRALGTGSGQRHGGAWLGVWGLEELCACLCLCIYTFVFTHVQTMNCHRLAAPYMSRCRKNLYVIGE